MRPLLFRITPATGQPLRGWRLVLGALTLNIIIELQFSHRAAGGVGGFSALFRLAPLHEACLRVRRTDVYVTATGVIRGKTGPAPSGALLFRPFSWAMQEKGQGNRGRLGVARRGCFNKLNAGSTSSVNTSTSLLRRAQHKQRKQRRETG